MTNLDCQRINDLISGINERCKLLFVLVKLNLSNATSVNNATGILNELNIPDIYEEVQTNRDNLVKIQNIIQENEKKLETIQQTTNTQNQDIKMFQQTLNTYTSQINQIVTEFNRL